MNKTTAKALEQSIKHWERMRDGKHGKLEGPYEDDCALCKVFIIGKRSCTGCPVKKSTSFDYCLESPYIAAREAWDEDGYDSDEFKAAAQKMIDFLISLRDPS